jgi:transcription elongation factor GreA
MKNVFTKPEKWSIFWKQFVLDVEKLVLESIPIVAVISVFIGAVIVLQTASNLENPLIPKMYVGYMTEEGYNKILAEINLLETVKRPEISHQIAEARDKGDLSENAEYDAAKEAQGILEAKIAQLKGLIANARLIDESQLRSDVVQIMSKVKIKNVKNNMVMSYTLVSDSEANLRENKIAVSTPIAKGLMGKKVGDVVDIKVPSGIVSYQVEEISI